MALLRKKIKNEKIGRHEFHPERHSAKCTAVYFIEIVSRWRTPTCTATVLHALEYFTKSANGQKLECFNAVLTV